jgi:hypothetical protein
MCEKGKEIIVRDLPQPHTTRRRVHDQEEDI